MAWALSVKLFPYICVALYHLKHILHVFSFNPQKHYVKEKNHIIIMMMMMNAYHMPMSNTLHILSYLILLLSFEVGTTIIPVYK